MCLFSTVILIEEEGLLGADGPQALIRFSPNQQIPSSASTNAADCCERSSCLNVQPFPPLRYALSGGSRALPSPDEPLFAMK